ncbi:MAG TPA: DUF2062 domain-containing protein [Candidatus Angelobacter sp.]|nr:DUF2062 domain-containing protein [Candidatus Angelobacter sp.]
MPFNVKRWMREHSLKLLAIRDTPEAIAGGVAIGLFFGFTPLYGLKTLGAIFFAWLTRSNIIAAVLAGTLYDLLLPIMPVVFIWEYKLGYWLLYQVWPHGVPLHISIHEWRDWTKLITSRVGKPLLMGSIFIATPIAGVCFFVTKWIVARHHRKHPHTATDSKEVAT